MLAVIDWGHIGELLWAAPAATLAVSLSFSLLVVGVSRASEMRRTGAWGPTVLYALLGLVAGLVFAGVVVEGVRIIVVK
jgi:hypothetical protein